ncbi:cubilin isoform X3 [Drosophila mojavensis]|uniref:cubilin isoform X3 n=1 Tax=Drosophila mojavensis TaxID=7230 RepID=UPI001CD129B0|nr:cubilin isoform X3 [Drosophila mojavensis]
MASAQIRHFYNTPTTTTNKSPSSTTNQLLQQQRQQQHTVNSKRKQFESEAFVCHTTTQSELEAAAGTTTTATAAAATWQLSTPATLGAATATTTTATAAAAATSSDDVQTSGSKKGVSTWLWTIYEIAISSSRSRSNNNNNNSSNNNRDNRMLQHVGTESEQQQPHQQYPVARSYGANVTDGYNDIGSSGTGWQRVAVATMGATAAAVGRSQLAATDNCNTTAATATASICKPAIQSRLSSKNKHGQGQDSTTATQTAVTPTTTTTTTATTKQQRKVYQHCTNDDAAIAQGTRTVKFFMDMQKFARTVFPLVIVFNLLPLFYAGTFQEAIQEQCDQTFVSRIGGPQNGTFTAPLLHNHRNHSRQCLYTFLAGPGQRVEVVFKSFNLRGSPPDGSAVGELPSCVHEYMDIYSEVQSSEPAELINSPFGGRYCGAIPPRRRISMYRAVAISFFSNKNVSTDLFEGTFRFINASEYEIGIPIAGSPCSYTITPSMSINKTGALISPTYPGAYPKDMSCTYQFLGESNQRVRLEFRDFDLFFGGPHCPFDYVKVYDGPDNSSALIGTYCGQQRNLVLYSSESSLFVHFYTLPRTANSQNRGFKGIYEFSESFVKLDFIRENDGIHIRGSECDQKILSNKESTGFVLSPNYPYPYIQKTVCRYFIYGMQDAQHLERVRLEFISFNIPKVEHKDKGESNCTDGYLKIYLKGQETADAYDKFDYELCGNETQRVISDGPRLAMVFSSGELQGRGFKGKYTFETEYKIPGTAAPDGTCSFTYVSSSKKRGELNSPRYPSNYPSDTNCSYLFLAEPNEQVTIVFDHFKIKADNNVNATAGSYGSGACFEDWLEMYVVYRDNNDRLLGRYCGLTAPGPVESPRGAVGLRITLHTDQESVASGFKARYFFESAKSDAGDCGGNFSNEDSGIITSPNYPAGYKAPGRGMASNACNWVMTARAGYKLSINFEQFGLEGDPANRGCPAAVLRLWVNVDSDQPPLELCGEKPPIEHWHYISTGQTARISFTTSDKTVGAQGFRIVWTEIQDSGPGPPSIGLLCESTYHFQCAAGYCISDKLRCDGVKNCGPGDDSDELHCITEAAEEDHDVLIIITLVVASSLICLLCTLCHSRRKRRNHVRQLGLHRNAHYDSQTSATAGLSSSRRHLQSGGASIAGSLHGINSGTLIIPPAPLPPTSVPPPPHICIAGVDMSHGLMNDDDDDEDDDDLELDEDQLAADIFINDVHFDEDNIDHVNQMANV